MRFQKGNKVNVGCIPWNKGKSLSGAHKEKLSKANEGQIPWNKGLEGISGVILSEETKKKISKTLSGHKISEGSKLKMSLAHRGKKCPFNIGNKNHRWNGGISKGIYPDEWIDDLRETIRRRDNYICQECGLHQDELEGWYRKLDIHHIDYDKKNLNPKNLVSLCRSCHMKTNINRDYWIEYFIDYLT